MTAILSYWMEHDCHTLLLKPAPKGLQMRRFSATLPSENCHTQLQSAAYSLSSAVTLGVREENENGFEPLARPELE
jgi:hypothetical protein